MKTAIAIEKIAAGHITRSKIKTALEKLMENGKKYSKSMGLTKEEVRKRVCEARQELWK
ncbi:hypothetical protein BR63_03710 [Thermanaerosceptrum fracticalcis]|uniref:Uncharacterized protein n=1 Tax=Thermanaerosceptrum fracticalcis TaxID=1712410 RepID=A0A7G6E095_THEFR|nr:hypothetical protein [Thermanaerosceptrum fracticalcis]QNB45499.1 hypothetical protein BR63_03710 [Thermanaerosceptrum fracticalcis]